ncbi:MAG: LuxR C-terminal-related transcriptional regulator [Bacilli bacterium]
MTIRVAVVDVHPLFRRRVIGILQATEDIEVVGEGIDSADAVDLVEQVLPDVLIMEMSTPKKTYRETIQRLRALIPPLKILILSVREEEKSFFDAMIQGAQGYIIRMIDPDELVHAVHRVHLGETVLPSDLALRILSDRRRSKQFTLQGDATPLTVREEEVLRELGTGAINKDIAQRLSICEHTVRFHVRNILNKLHLSNRVEAAAYAKRDGLVKK